MKKSKLQHKHLSYRTKIVLGFRIYTLVRLIFSSKDNQDPSFIHFSTREHHLIIIKNLYVLPSSFGELFYKWQRYQMMYRWRIFMTGQLDEIKTLGSSDAGSTVGSSAVQGGIACR